MADNESCVPGGATLTIERSAPEGNRSPLPGRPLPHADPGLLYEELRRGAPTTDGIARKLAGSKRTLQRRLQESDLDFSARLDEARRDLSLLYLREKSLAVYEVAYLLGYTEPSAFFRAFKRWTGKTPSEVRAASNRAA